MVGRSVIPTESQEQIAFVNWFRSQFPRVLIFAVPNGAHLAGGGGQRAAKMARMKAEGLVNGIPDLCVPEWRLWIEMKRQRGGRVSPDQRDVHDYLRGIGHEVIVGRGWEDARDAVMATDRSAWRSIGQIIDGMTIGDVQ